MQTSVHAGIKLTHVLSALQSNQPFVDVTALLTDMQDKTKGMTFVSQALKSAITGRSSTKHIILSSSTEAKVPVFAYLIELLFSVCDFTILSISNIDFIAGADAVEEGGKSSMDGKPALSGSLHTLNLTNLAVKKDVEGPFEALIRSLVARCEHISINGIAYETEDGGECRFFKGLATSKNSYRIRTVQYIPNIFLNNLLIRNAYGKSDKQMVSKIYAQFLLETLPALFIFLLFTSEGPETISLYLDLIYLNTSQIQACLDEVKAFLLLCSSLRSIKLLLHGDKVDSQLMLSDTMGPLPAAMNKAFECLGIYSEYKEDLVKTVTSVKAAFSEATNAISSPGGYNNKFKFFMSLCNSVFIKLNVPLPSISAKGDGGAAREEYCQLLRCTPGAFELFIKIFQELAAIEGESITFSARVYTNLIRLSIADPNKVVKTPTITHSLTSSKRVDSARRRIGSPTILPVSSPEGAGEGPGPSPTRANQSPSNTATSMTRSALRRSDLQNSNVTHQSKTAIHNLTTGTSMQLSNDTLAINTSGPISVNDLLTRNSTANNHLRAELHSMLLDILPETQIVKDLTSRVSLQEDSLIELRNCVLLLAERISPDALSKDEANYVSSVLRGTMVGDV